jgi:exonuclease SbcD
MKVLHTSDWHLGQKLIGKEREEEHRLALDWLSGIIQSEKIDLLLVAGDVFDTGNPPNYARALYYTFLKKLRFSGCRHVVITGGNHDSPAMLEAPKELLQLLDVHVVGGITDKVEDEIRVLNNQNGEPEVIVAAVPFLRDQDLRHAYTGETGQERIERIKQGILNHYLAVGAAVEALSLSNIPIIGMGHLSVTGSESSDRQENIYLGNIENIEAESFPSVFDYVALGHIHRPQAIGGFEKIRYCGSLIPLSFSETKDDKTVVIVDFSGNEITNIRQLAVPLFRRLKTIEGNFETVQERLEALDAKYGDKLTTWVEVLVETETLIPNLDGLLEDYTKDMNLEILRTRLKRRHFSLDEQVEGLELEDFKPLEVFRKKCESAGKTPDEIESLVSTFRELETWNQQRQEK